MKKIKISETQFNRVIKRSITEQELNTKCKLCVGVALGATYAGKVIKISRMLEDFQEKNITPTKKDMDKLMTGIDITDVVTIAPKLLKCYDKCQPKEKTPEKQLEEGLKSTFKGIGGYFKGQGYNFTKYGYEIKKELIKFNKQLIKTFDKIDGIYENAEDSRMSNKAWEILKNHLKDAKDAYEMTYDTNNVILQDLEAIFTSERKKDDEGKKKERETLGDVKVEPQFQR